jgi:putative methanogen marker protein 4
MDIVSRIAEISRRNRARVGIGINSKEIVPYAEKAKEFAEVVLIGKEVKVTDFEIIETDTPAKELVKLLFEGEIDSAVRGNLSASETLYHLRMRLGRIYRMALLQTASGILFFLAPVGIDEGVTREEKIEIIIRGVELLKRLGIHPSVGVLSGGRLEDIDRGEVIERTIQDAEYIVEKVGKLGIDAVHHQILIEDAIGSSNIIIAPDGIIGNLIFRTLVFLGNGKGFGAPVLTSETTFIDTSRAGESYTRAIMLASALAKRRGVSARNTHHRSSGSPCNDRCTL